MTDDSLYEVSVELLADTLANYSGFFTESHFASLQALLGTPWSQKRYRVLVHGDLEFESSQFGQLLVAFGDARVELLMRLTDESSQQCLSQLCGLLGVPGYPVGDDKIFIPALEFWSTFVETMGDIMYSGGDAPGGWVA